MPKLTEVFKIVEARFPWEKFPSHEDPGFYRQKVNPHVHPNTSEPGQHFRFVDDEESPEEAPSVVVFWVPNANNQQVIRDLNGRDITDVNTNGVRGGRTKFEVTPADDAQAQRLIDYLRDLLGPGADDNFVNTRWKHLVS